MNSMNREVSSPIQMPGEKKARTVTGVGELLAAHVERLDLEVPKSHLPERWLQAGHEEIAVLAKAADILAVKE